MTANKRLYIGLSLTATWRKGRFHDQIDDDAGKGYTIDFYIYLAKLAEQAKLDFVFKPDSLFFHKGPSGRSRGYTSLDPTLMLAAVAQATEKIGLVTTISTTFNPPYVVARQLQSLHWISNGRAGWNIVTSLDGANNFSNAPMPSAEQKYAKAIEFTNVVQKLWKSYPYEALEETSATDGLDEKPCIESIDHIGEYFQVKGPLNVPAHPSGTIPLFQAGASNTGRNFAASIADAIFAATPDLTAGIELRQDLIKRAKAYGRSENAVRVLPGMYFFLSETREEAWNMYHQTHAHLTLEHRYKSVQSILGLDISQLPLDQKLTAEILPSEDQPVRSRTHADLLRRLITEQQPTVEQLLNRPEVIGSAHWVVVGTVDDAVQEIKTWYEAGALDGFIALPGGSIQSLYLFVDQLVPMLVREGLYRGEYTGTTLREHLEIK